jgi:hypothetical protein
VLKKPVLSPIKTLVNHVIFLVDESGSMQYHSAKVNEVMRGLAAPLTSAAQKTLVSVYSFDSTVNREAFCADPSILSGISHSARGQTALVDATYIAINDHLNIHTRADEDHSFLIYVITDGEENASRQYNANALRRLIDGLDDHWTVATLVPNITAVHAAKQFGFPAGNIEVWPTNSAKGFEEVGRQLATSYVNYSAMRSMGGTQSATMFVNTANLTKSDIKAVLVEDKTAILAPVRVDTRIDDFVAKVTGKPYEKGKTFYELLKSEDVQPYKEIAIVNRKDDKRYFGDQARGMLGVTSTGILHLRPGNFGDWRVFVQSTSLNRKLKAGSSVLIRQQ